MIENRLNHMIFNDFPMAQN